MFRVIACMFRHLDLSHQPGFTAILRAGPSTLQSVGDTCESVPIEARCIGVRITVGVGVYRCALRQGLTRSRVLPCSWIVGECVSTGEIMLESGGVVLLLPFCETAHVSRRRLSGRPDY